MKRIPLSGSKPFYTARCSMRTAFGITLAGCLIVLSCSDVTAPDTRLLLVFDPPTVSPLEMGEHATLRVTARNQDGITVTTPALQWATDASDVIVLIAGGSASAEVIGMSEGRATITVSGGGSTASVAVDVVPSTVSLVEIEADSINISRYDTAVVAVHLTDRRGNLLSDRHVSWRSDDSLIAVGRGTGTIEANKEGRVWLHAEVDAIKDSVLVAVSWARVVTAVLQGVPERLETGDSVQIALVALDTRGGTLADRTVSWRSTDTAIATITQSGLIHGRMPGGFEVHASIEDAADTAAVTVFAQVRSISLPPGDVRLRSGDSTRLVLTAMDARGTHLEGVTAEWTTNDATVLDVRNDGTVVARSAGSAIIRARVDQLSDSALVVVGIPGSVEVHASLAADVPEIIRREVVAIGTAAELAPFPAQGAVPLFAWGGKAEALAVALGPGDTPLLFVLFAPEVGVRVDLGLTSTAVVVSRIAMDMLTSESLIPADIDRAILTANSFSALRSVIQRHLSATQPDLGHGEVWDAARRVASEATIALGLTGSAHQSTAGAVRGQVNAGPTGVAADGVLLPTSILTDRNLWIEDIPIGGAEVLNTTYLRWEIVTQTNEPQLNDSVIAPSNGFDPFEVFYRDATRTQLRGGGEEWFVTARQTHDTRVAHFQELGTYVVAFLVGQLVSDGSISIAACKEAVLASVMLTLYDAARLESGALARGEFTRPDVWVVDVLSDPGVQLGCGQLIVGSAAARLWRSLARFILSRLNTLAQINGIIDFSGTFLLAQQTWEWWSTEVQARICEDRGTFATCVGSVDIATAVDSVQQMDTLRLHAVVRDTMGTALEDRQVRWRVNDTYVASVSSDGLLRAVEVGSAHVVAEVGGRADSILVRFVPRALPLVTVVERDTHDSELLDPLPPTHLPRGGTYEVSVRGTRLGDVNTVRTNSVDVTGSVLSVSDTLVRISITSTAVAEGDTALAPIPAVLVSLEESDADRGSNEFTLSIVEGPVPVAGLQISNGVTSVTRGDTVTIEFEADFQVAGNGQFHFVGCGDCRVEWGTRTGNAFRATQLFTLTVMVPPISRDTAFGVRVGVVTGSGSVGDLTMYLPILFPPPPAGSLIMGTWSYDTGARVGCEGAAVAGNASIGAGIWSVTLQMCVAVRQPDGGVTWTLTPIVDHGTWETAPTVSFDMAISGHFNGSNNPNGFAGFRSDGVGETYDLSTGQVCSYVASRCTGDVGLFLLFLLGEWRR